MQISSKTLFRPDRQNRGLLLLTLCLDARPAIARQDETKPDLLRAAVPEFETLRPPNPKLPDKTTPQKAETPRRLSRQTGSNPNRRKPINKMKPADVDCQSRNLKGNSTPETNNYELRRKKK